MDDTRNMNGEILTLETAQKLARIDITLKYIDDRLRKAYTTYNLTGDAVVMLQCVEALLKGDLKWKDSQI